MRSFIKKLFSLALVAVIVVLVLNLRVGGKAARDYAVEVWNHRLVQITYQAVKTRIQAVINKDISVEEVFDPNLTLNESKKAAKAEQPKNKKVSVSLDEIDAQDRKNLERILKKYNK